MSVNDLSLSSSKCVRETTLNSANWSDVKMVSGNSSSRVLFTIIWASTVVMREREVRSGNMRCNSSRRRKRSDEHVIRYADSRAGSTHNAPPSESVIASLSRCKMYENGEKNSVGVDERMWVSGSKEFLLLHGLPPKDNISTLNFPQYCHTNVAKVVDSLKDTREYLKWRIRSTMKRHFTTDGEVRPLAKNLSGYLVNWQCVSMSIIRGHIHVGHIESACPRFCITMEWR